MAPQVPSGISHLQLVLAKFHCPFKHMSLSDSVHIGTAPCKSHFASHFVSEQDHRPPETGLTSEISQWDLDVVVVRLVVVVVSVVVGRGWFPKINDELTSFSSLASNSGLAFVRHFGLVDADPCTFQE